MRAYHIYLLRHGLTQGNEEGRYIGRTDLPLSDNGRLQLMQMSQQYSYPYAENFFCSPMERCKESLSILYPGSEPEIVPDLRECDFGAYEGRSFDELQDDPDYEKWSTGGGRVAPPEGEGSVDFQNRCCAAFEGIVDGLLHSGRRSALIMAHGGTIMSILGRYAYPRKPFYEWLTGNGMGYEVIVTPSLWLNDKVIEAAGYLPDDAYELQRSFLSKYARDIDKIKENVSADD